MSGPLYTNLITVKKYEHPIQRKVKVEQNKLYIDQDAIDQKTQSFGRSYHDAGQFYCVNRERVYSDMPLIADGDIPYVLSPFECQDIDTREDYEISRIKYEYLKGVRQ